jgi:hypothetical protein
MSATREILCEKISVYEAAILKAEQEGTSTEFLRQELDNLRAQLVTVNKTLNEGRTILKG